MTSNPVVLRPRSRAVVLLTKIKSRPFLGTTLAFFRKGDELEATEFENLPHDDPALVPPKLGFRNFDRVQRRWAPLMILLLVIVAAGLTLFERDRAPEVRGETARVTAAVGSKLSDGWARVKELVNPTRAAR